MAATLTSWMSLLLLPLSSSACETQKVPEASPATRGVTETNAEMLGLGKRQTRLEQGWQSLHHSRSRDPVPKQLLHEPRRDPGVTL